MTLQQFMNELKALKGKYKLVSGTHIRALKEETGYCPLVGVARYKGYDGDDYSGSAKYLKIGNNNMNLIIDSADNEKRGVVRRSLLKTLGLKEK